MFFSLFFLAQVFAAYICARGIFCITQKVWLGVVTVLLSLTSVASFLAMMKDENKISWLLDGICYVGYVYLGFIVYFSLVCIVGFVFAKFYPEFKLSRFLSFGLAGVMIVLLMGYMNAMKPRLKRIVVPCNVNMKICFLSDIHVGLINTDSMLLKISKLIRQIEPDLVVLGGDMFDKKGIRDYQEEFIKIFTPITSKYKTIGVVGNHELYTGVSACLSVLQKAGIHMLVDDFVTVNGVNFVGRMDCSINKRKKLTEILPQNGYPTIVVDHSPIAVRESVNNSVLLQLSGHTHGGQMFPMSIVISLMYEPTGTLKKIKDTYLYITYGAGFWGPPYRIGTTPEVVLVELKK